MWMNKAVRCALPLSGWISAVLPDQSRWGAVGPGLSPGQDEGTVAYLQAEAEANWIRTHQPEIWSRTYKYLFLSGYLTYRLVGRLSIRLAARWATCPSTIRARPGLTSNWKWQAVPMDPSLLPDLVPAGSVG